MLTYSMNDINGESLYEHLYKCIKNDITAGSLPADTKLPSKRTFAKNLGISVITVENAYSQLMAEGYIYSLPKKGYFVAGLSVINSPHPSSEAEDSHMPKPSSESEKFSLFADFIGSRTMQDNFPFTVWAKLLREVMTEQSELLLETPPSGGIMLLRETITEHLHQFRGMNVSPEQIIIGAGTEYLYGLIIQLLGRDKIFAVENPGYQKISMVYARNDVKFRYIPLDENGISMSVLESSDADILHLSPSHHYPTGLVTPVTRRHRLLDWAAKSDSRFIIEDDYDCEFRMFGKPIPTMQSIDKNGKVIYMNTFTKTLASTIRISYMVLPPELLNRFYSRLGFYSCTVSTFEQLTLYKFMSKGYFEKHINRMRNFYRNQRNLILDAIKKSPLGSVCVVKEQDAGLHFLLSVPSRYSHDELVKRAETLHIKIGFLSQFYYDEGDSRTEDNSCADAECSSNETIPHEHPAEGTITESATADSSKNQIHTLVINYSGITPVKIHQAVELLCECLLGE